MATIVNKHVNFASIIYLLLINYCHVKVDVANSVESSSEDETSHYFMKSIRSSS